MKFQTELISPGPAIRRVVVELTEGQAEALADAINEGIDWAETRVEDELAALHGALRGWTT